MLTLHAESERKRLAPRSAQAKSSGWKHFPSILSQIGKALVEALDATFLTCDAQVGKSAGHRAEVEVV